MDDDLSSLMNNSPEDDDIFNAFATPSGSGGSFSDDLTLDAPSALEEDDFFPTAPSPPMPPDDDPFGLGFEAAPASRMVDDLTLSGARSRDVRQATAKRSATRTAKRRPTGFLGMTAMQRMIISFFLFLDVTVVGILLLIALGASAL